jgi:serine/threonine-protein kinase
VDATGPATKSGLFSGQIGPYQLVREVGRGAAGVVYEARDPEDRRLALKLLTWPVGMQAEDRETFRRRFLREARALSAVHHPNVVPIHDAGEEEGRLYLAMEFLDGENLRALLTHTGALPPAEAVPLLLQLCDALEAVHQAGIIHRDVKPENVVVMADGGVKLTDFGVAWMENEATLTRTGGVLGSPAYMSPEQVLGKPVDRRSDVYSLAVTLYQVLTGALPFEGGSLLELAQQVAYQTPPPPCLPGHERLVRAMMQGLQKSPNARHASAADFADALRAALTSDEVRPATPLAEATLLDAPATTRVCPRHPRQPVLGDCAVCGRALCAACARGRGRLYCRMHAPLTLFGISTVRLEVAIALAAFVSLMLAATTWGAVLFRH